MGDEVEVEAWQPVHRIPPLAGLQGHGSIPKKGDMVTVYVEGKKGKAYEPILPNGIVILIGAPALGVGLLMVSRIRYPHIVNQYIRGRRPFSYLVKLLLFGLGMVLAPAIAAAAVTLLYVTSSPIRAGWRLIRARSAT